MEKEVLKEPNVQEELLAILRSPLSKDELSDSLRDYHEKDIADALEMLTPEERQKLYPLLGAEYVSEIFAYVEDPDKYFAELNIESAAKILSNMDSDDAVDVLEELDDDVQKQIVDLLDEDASRDVQLILSYEDDEIGSIMTTNFIQIHYKLTVRQAMRELVKQAGENDNISILYAVDDDNHFYGAMDLKDLIIAREGTKLEDLISTSFPTVGDHDKISESLERIKDYAEDSIPVVSDEGIILGVITSQDIVEVVDDEMGDDYAKLAGLTAEEDLKETTGQSMKKRLPWLLALLVLGIIVSSVVGVFETVVAVLPIVMCFQSLILDMAGNVGTQSLAVTIRVLMDEELTTGQKFGLVWKEMRVGFCNGLFLGSITFVFVGLYIWLLKKQPVEVSFLISGCVGVSLLASMIISSLVGTLIPLFFHKIKVDPAVASGPLITTVNDLVAVVTYYGLSWILLLEVFRHFTEPIMTTI
ncbi:MAG: magnesium transporter [Lachnospiraceae bacterium]|nr:magnesium transporter [Lachnospiraceae bacterium]